MSNISQSHCILSLTLGKIRALSESLFIYSRNARSRPPKLKSSTTKELHFPFPATHKLRFAVTVMLKLNFGRLFIYDIVL